MQTVRCPFCEQEFEQRQKKQKFCSHACASSFYHGKRELGAIRPASEFVNGDNPKYRQDEKGQWWYYGSKVRTRAKVKRCAFCDREYLFSVFHKTECCSQTCGQKLFNRNNPERFRGDNSKRWKGGRQVRFGYVFIHQPSHPSCQGNKRAYVAEHRLVMEQLLGRYLTSDEQVHHKNGVRDDNRPENLELWAVSQPAGQRAHEQQHCSTCTCGGLQHD